MTQQSLIAVVGMDGIFPGAPDLDRFWHNLVNGIDRSAPVPRARWIASVDDRLSATLTPDRPYSSHACLIDDFHFDPGAFSLDPAWTRRLDPVHQLTLTAGKRAVKRCKMTSVDPQRVDTILAAIALPTDGASAFCRNIYNPAIESRLFPRGSVSSTRLSRVDALASRVDGLPVALLAAEMRFGGDCFTLDAACASSIYAVKLACDALIGGRADMVVTGGVSRPECLYPQTGFSQLQALSPSGRCAPFDHRADGLVVGEGVGILVLKRLDDALAHGDTIFGVIHGIGLSNDLRGNLLAPERDGQVRAMRQAYRSAGWRPSDVDYIECHGTGTRAGDTTEIESLIRLWEGEANTPGACAIGSVKSMIGHLLTAAGAAGMIKTLLAMQHQTLPPSIHFDDAGPDSPLAGSPFDVQRSPAPWNPRSEDRLRRAAVSAFGFGGINAHILFAEGPKPSSAGKGDNIPRVGVRSRSDSPSMEAMAIVGMDVRSGQLGDLQAFAEAVVHGKTLMNQRPAGRWKQADATLVDLLDGCDPAGAYMDRLSLGIGEFQIPPNEIGDILPQQLLALKVGARALADAGLRLREPRERMGVVVGIGFDFEATNFHLRWQLSEAVGQWRDRHGLSLAPQELSRWLTALRDGCAPPLTAPRVLGALGGIVASRMAREFRFGGPSFVVSADAAAGIKALQVAVDLIQQGTADAMLVGAVDLSGDGRSVVRLSRMLPISPANALRPFDRDADGTLPGDGAAALVLKSLARARSDGDRIYAVIRGIGSAGGDDALNGRLAEATYRRSLERCFEQADISPETVSYVESHGAGVPDQDRLEAIALAHYFGRIPRKDPSTAIALGSCKPISGHAGAADALIALAKTALCLHRRILPPLPAFCQPPDDLPELQAFHLPIRAHHWYRDRQDGPRTACCASITVDGACAHVLLQEPEGMAMPAAAADGVTVGQATSALFALTGDTPRSLLEGLNTLRDHLRPSADGSPVLHAAARWQKDHPVDPQDPLAVALIIADDDDRSAVIHEARQAVTDGAADPRSRKVFHHRHPLGAGARIAWVYPGSGNHYLGMGRQLALRFPAILAAMDRQTAQLKTQLRPWQLMPWRTSWAPGWESDATATLKADPLNMIFGQVVFADLMTRILNSFAISANAIIGYSLGESAALFAHGIWADRGEMLARMQATDLFTTQLAGPCLSLRQAWQIPEDAPVDWTVAVVNRPADRVRRIIVRRDHVRLLIVNAPDECVIGGLGPAVQQAISDLDCQAVFLDGVVTVHCDAAAPVADEYRDLHRFATTAKPDLTVYSCSLATSILPTPEECANSIKKQAIDGFDFTQSIKRAYADGIRIFLEAGPRASCTRMIGRILGDVPHLAVAANHGGDDETGALMRCLARLVVERVPMNLAPLYAGLPETTRSTTRSSSIVEVVVGGQPLVPVPPASEPKAPDLPTSPAPPSDRPSPVASSASPSPTAASDTPLWSSLLEAAQETISATSRAHERFLELSGELTQQYAEVFDLQNRLLARGAKEKDASIRFAPPSSAVDPSPPLHPSSVAFDRDKCMEFAIGRVGRVLGPAFDSVDTYRVRVRLPDEPLMLVDRIHSVEGEMLSLGSGRVVTEHDVKPGAWYLDGGRAPVCISVEAGQADLFLSAYLGIDHQVKGERAYRLLDATVAFHRGLPLPGETVRYDIAIDRFVRQGDTWMFFFHFDGFVGEEHLITMRDGCAGFFTEEEVSNSGGILLTEAERQPAPGTCPPDWQPPVPMTREAYGDDQVDALRRGDLAGCFGDRFAGIDLSPSLWLPDGRMRLIHRILELDPVGGRYGLGSIRAEADIHPDDWFLTCHFVDDKVMPGTLMYECCAHTLRVFLQRLGWVTDKPDVAYEPVLGNAARLKCRGPVTPQTRHVHYQIEISRIGYAPEPYAIADAHMDADGHPIVFFKDMSMKLSGVSRAEIDALWQHRAGRTQGRPDVLYDRSSILAFAVGNPSEAFGAPYRVFDSQRTIARLPGPPYCFMDRVTQVEPPPWQLKADGWVTAQYDVPPAAWYFNADRSGEMPFCVLLEIALQPCGWLAAYAGSALRSNRDLKFRNLGGSAVMHRPVMPDSGSLTMRCRMTKVSEAADMIIENFDFEVLAGDTPVYTGDTYFGFFSAPALAQQKGLGDADAMVRAMAAHADLTDGGALLDAKAPLTPEAGEGLTVSVDELTLPGKALLMIDRIEAFDPAGGPSAMGYIRGIKQVDPAEWFFKAHFYQDPVCPGSLGLESFLQLLKIVALKRWPHLTASHRFRLGLGHRHRWSYRGQIIPSNKKVVVEASITQIKNGEAPRVRADGLLSVDGLPIYKMENFELALVPAETDWKR